MSNREGETLTPDICVIGAGSGGLSVAAAAAQFGVEVVLIEKGKMGGDCLNYGCVPSKALLAAAKRAYDMETSRGFGISPAIPLIDPIAVNTHIREVIAAIEPNDSVERFTGLGVRVITAPARFTGPKTVAAGPHTIKARRFVIATGSSPLAPPIPGLDQVPYLTNETLFDNKEKFTHLLIIGGGPIGMEMAQAHNRLGMPVTVIERMKVLSKDDPEMSAVLLHRMRAEGVTILEGTDIIAAAQTGMNEITLSVKNVDGEGQLKGSDLLVAVGRGPNIDGLNLDAAEIAFDNRGIKVSNGLVTSNRRVFAIGDVIGGAQFTHAANYHAGIVIKRALFRIPARVNDDLMPWVTYTDPELAQVGLMEDDARKRYRKINVLRWPFSENDRAQAERRTDGSIKVITLPNGRILGATIVGVQAGEMIQTWSLAISSKLKIGQMTKFIAPYPTRSEATKRAAYAHFLPKLTNPLVRKTVKVLNRLG